jgi:hypothetical protein
MVEDQPRIHIRFPHVEDFEGAVAALRATGARPELRGRCFVIEGTMTIPEVVALFDLMRWVDGGSDPAPFEVSFNCEIEGDETLRDDAVEWWEKTCMEAWG